LLKVDANLPRIMPLKKSFIGFCLRLEACTGYNRAKAAVRNLLETVGLRDRTHTLVCVTGDDVKNVFVTVSARRMNDGLRIISRAGTKQVGRKLMLAGANHVVSPSEVAGPIGAEYVGRLVAFGAIYGILRGKRDIALEAAQVESDSQACASGASSPGRWSPPFWTAPCSARPTSTWRNCRCRTTAS
jgi:hypothetical protein